MRQRIYSIAYKALTIFILTDSQVEKNQFIYIVISQVTLSLL